MPRITRSQFEASKRHHVLRDDLLINELYGLRFMPPESPEGWHLPLFMTGHTGEKFQWLGRLITATTEPEITRVRLDVGPDGYLDGLRFTDGIQLVRGAECLTDIDLSTEEGYLLKTTGVAEGLNPAALALLTLRHKQTSKIREPFGYYPEAL